MPQVLCLLKHVIKHQIKFYSEIFTFGDREMEVWCFHGIKHLMAPLLSQYIRDLHTFWKFEALISKNEKR